MLDIIDLGTVVETACGSWDTLRSLEDALPDTRKQQYLSHHFKQSPSENLQSHSVTKLGKTWNVSFQLKWLEQFPWLSYSALLSGGICRCCILFPEQVCRGGGLGGGRSGCLILSPYKKPYSKALGKDGVLVCHEQTVMHNRAAERADLFLRNVNNPTERVDTRLMNGKNQQAEENKHILRQLVLAVAFLAKQALPFRGSHDHGVDFLKEDTNRANFVATLQLMAKGDSIRQKHLLYAKGNAKYTIQNGVIHIYACKIRERLTKQLRDNNLPFTVIADECTDPHSNQEILSVCLRYVDLSSHCDPHIKECLINFVYLERAHAASISRKTLEAISHPSVCLDPCNIRGQAYDGAFVMSSSIAGVQAKIKEISPTALWQ